METGDGQVSRLCVPFPGSKIMYIGNGKVEKFDRSILLNANWHFLELFGQNAQSRSMASCILL